MQGIIFDLDGTLVDSLTHWYNLNIEFFTRFNLEPNEDLFTMFKSLSLEQSASIIVERFELSQTSSEIKDIWLSMAEDMYVNKVKLKPYAYEYLNLLKTKGIKFGIATATFNNLAIICLKANNVYELFDFVIDVNTYNTNKGEPLIYLKALEMLNISMEDCVVFEDAPYAAKTAKEAGFKVIGVSDKLWDKEASQLSKYTDNIINSFEELLA